MSEAIAKKYIKALVGSIAEGELSEINSALTALSSAFGSQKFNNIILSNDVTKSDKENFILSMVEKPNDKLTNFIKLLTENGRLGDIPAMAKELQKQIAIKSNTYQGVLISNFDVDSAQVTDIEKSLSSKLGSTITLENRVTDYPGLKVEIEDLGVEVGLSTARVKAQLAEHILKAL
jgi:F-type H+-transporting ATPase subunit delta